MYPLAFISHDVDIVLAVLFGLACLVVIFGYRPWIR